MKQYRETHGDAQKAAGKAWRDKNKEKVRAYAKAYKLDNPAKRILYSAKQRATKDGLDFDLVLEDIVVPTRCPYLGIELTNIFKQGRVWSNPSIDRVDPTKGYVKGNIQIVSDLANRMKQNATADQLVTFAKNVLELNGTRSQDS